MKHEGRHWSVGFSVNCGHRPRCANIYWTDGHQDVTFPCSGLSRHDALTIVAAVNAAGKPMEEIDAELLREQLRLDTLAGKATS